MSFRAFCDRVYKPGSVIDSHLSRRIVAGALQPPPRKQPGRPCFLHGVAPDRVYSIGRFHADACALTARFHPYLVRRKKLHILRSAAKRHCSYIPFFLLYRGKQRFPRLLPNVERWLHVSEQLAIWTRRYISVALFLRSLWAGVTRYPCPVEPGLSSWCGRWAAPRDCPSRSREYCT